MILREYQQRAIDELRAAFARGHRSVVFCLPTGGGKTPVLAHIIALAVVRGQRVLFVAGMVELLNQALAKLALAGVDRVRVVQADRLEGPEDAQVTVASVQTLVTEKWLANPIPADFLILDECHHGAARTWAQLIALYPKARILGATATTQRGDGRALSMFSHLVVGSTVRKLTETGYLVPARVFAPLSTLGPRELAMDPFAAYERYARGQRAIVFCETIVHARVVAEQFAQRGVIARSVTGSQPDRDDVMSAFARGDFSVLTNVKLVVEGIDVPDVSAGIFARKFTHVGPFLQACGRFLRPHEGKSHATIVDLKGSVLVHGTPDLDREWTLEGKGVASSEREPLRQCTSCGGVYASGARSSCIFCGAELPVLARPLPRSNGAGLAEVTRENKPQRVWYVPMKAKYAGICPQCGASYQAGDQIVWAKGEKPKHESCVRAGFMKRKERAA